jgi:hypothetical protein
MPDGLSPLLAVLYAMEMGLVRAIVSDVDRGAVALRIEMREVRKTEPEPEPEPDLNPNTKLTKPFYTSRSRRKLPPQTLLREES